jgi:hypothetical protein
MSGLRLSLGLLRAVCGFVQRVGKGVEEVRGAVMEEDFAAGC